MEHLSLMTSTTEPTAAGDFGNVAGFVVDLDGFSGPLDLLLHLVWSEQIDIADIPIARVADQFLAAIHALRLNQAADYLEMAGRLIRLKVQMLMPRGGEDAWEDPRAELVRRLLEYQQIKEIARWMAGQAERRSLRLARGYLPQPPELPSLPVTLDMMDLLVAVERVVNNIPSPVLHRVITRPLDVEGATRRIELLLERQGEFSWREAFPPNSSIVDVLSVLLALLELARRGACRFRQDASFGPLVISRESSAAPVAVH
jgi:segregation and condensation protein A